MYKILHYGTIIRLADSASIPPDLKNADYQDYLAWVALGNVAPVDPPPIPTAAELRFQNAKANAASIQQWKLWTMDQWVTWHTSKMSDAIIDALAIPAGAKTVLKDISLAILNIGKLLIALRDQVWPDLPDG